MNTTIFSDFYDSTKAFFETNYEAAHAKASEILTATAENEYVKVATTFLADNAAIINPGITAASSFLIVNSTVDLTKNKDTGSNLKALAKIVAGAAGIYFSQEQSHQVIAALAGSSIAAALNVKNKQLVITLDVGQLKHAELKA